jgi:hypothetical protein
MKTLVDLAQVNEAISQKWAKEKFDVSFAIPATVSQEDFDKIVKYLLYYGKKNFGNGIETSTEFNFATLMDKVNGVTRSSMTPEEKKIALALGKKVKAAMDKVHAVIVAWQAKNVYKARAKGKTLPELAKALYLHKDCGGETELPKGWEAKVAALEAKLAAPEMVEIELD